MDDTVVFATKNVGKKLHILKQCTDHIGMEIHPTKSKYLSVSGTGQVPIQIDNILISHTNQYVYLGTPISDSAITDQIRDHITKKESHVVKFSCFLAKNSDAPFHVKKKVWESALMCAILYSSETWLCDNFRAIERPYMNSLKLLLGVRQSTCNDLVLVDAGVGDAKRIVQVKESRFIQGIISCEDYHGSYLQFVVEQAIMHKTPMGKILKRIIASRVDDQVEMCLRRISVRIRSSDSSKRKTYLEMNANLSPCAIYWPTSYVPEYARLATTRIRLSSHNLRIETGRWARLNREDRLCPCYALESHALLDCPLTLDLRRECPLVTTCGSVQELFAYSDEYNVRILSCYCFEVLKRFSQQ